MATDYGRKPDSIGQPESMRNEEQKLRDGQGGSELTDLPDDHPVGAPGETASANAEGPPPVEGPDQDYPDPDAERDDVSRAEQRLRDTRVGPRGEVIPPEEPDE